MAYDFYLSKFPHARRGFTLVELAVVLVIIGLLIGGLLVGRDMISGSRITSFIAQTAEYDAAVMGFKSRFNYMPGDTPALGGDGDGTVENAQGTNSCYGGEISKFWHHLKPDEYANGANCPGVAVITTGATKNVPLSKLGKKGSAIIASIIGDWWGDGTGSYYIILDPTIVQNTTAAPNYTFSAVSSSNATVAPADAAAIDAKIDNRIANTGNVKAGGTYWHAGFGYGSPAARPLATCASGASYAVANSGNECMPLVRIGIGVGDPQ